MPIRHHTAMTAFTARGVAAAAAILCSAAPLPACWGRAEAPPVSREEAIVPVGAVAAETAAIRAVVHAGGMVVPSEGGEFLAVAPEPARIVEVGKAEGDAVTSGDTLVRFDLPSAAQEVARLAADLASAQAQLENARINQARIRDFVERGLVPRRDLEGVERELADAQGAVNRITTAHAAAQAAAARAIIRAPFDGVVAARRHNPGDLVLSTSADPVLRIVDPRRLEVVAFVPEFDIARVVPGATARIAGPVGSDAVRLTVSRPLADRTGSDKTMPFRLVFEQPTPLPVDTRVEIDIDAEARADAVLVPAEALVRDGAETAVFVAAGSRAVRRAVTTGIADGSRVEITSGVRAGELVITRGHIGLADGATISVATDRQ
jgi:RND family efflux transporter MFP subunit